MSGAFSRSVDVFISQSLSPQAQSKLLADTARAGVAGLIQSGRASPRYQRFVDGREGVIEDAVQPGGTIIYRFQVIGEAALFAMSFLMQRAPVKEGKYRKSLRYAIGGRMIRPESFDPEKVGNEVDEIFLFATVPYARKADVQLVGNRRLRFKVPPGIYDDAAAAVRRRFPTLNAVRLRTVRFPGMEYAQAGPRVLKRLEYPAVAISVR